MRDITLYGARRTNYPKDAQGLAITGYPSVPAFFWTRAVEVRFDAVGYVSDEDFNNDAQPMRRLRKSYPVSDVTSFQTANSETFTTIETAVQEILEIDGTWTITHLRVDSSIREMFARAVKGGTIKTLTLNGDDYQTEIDARREFAFDVIGMLWTYILTNDPDYWGASTEIV